LGFDKHLLNEIRVEKIILVRNINHSVELESVIVEQVTFKKSEFKSYKLEGNKPIKTSEDVANGDLNLEEYFKNHLPDFFYKELSHKVIFWKSIKKHLINEDINLETFGANPSETSIPLRNCFALAGIEEEDISEAIEKIKTTPAEINNLQVKLGDKVTTHIKKVWPNHPIKIKFQIDNLKLSFLVEDEKVKYQAKTTSQRSDGFRQFISFLLTISAESSSAQLANTILLIDEPETHLHPQAQEYLRDELIEITQNDATNIVLFATHSNYMIDKEKMQRCFRVVKQSNKKTIIEAINSGSMSYAEVNYEVFGIASTDYHNELYGCLEAQHASKLNAITQNKNWNNIKKGIVEKVSLPRYIRHAIHHPENTTNPKYTIDDMRQSLNMMRKLLNKE
jgi:hypothetical protein